MRLVIAAAVALAPASAAAADTPVTMLPLATGEVLLEVNASGSTRTRADLAAFSVTVNSTAATGEEARRQAEAATRNVVAAARAAGVPAADIRTETTAGVETSDESSMHVGAGAMEAGAGAAAAGQEGAFARSSIEFELRDVGRAEGLEHRLQQVSPGVEVEVRYSLADDRQARRTARAAAINTARADADAQAAALGMRVVRVLRVTDRIGFDFLSFVSQMEKAGLERMQDRSDPIVETVAVLGIDFALAPR